MAIFFQFTQRLNALGLTLKLSGSLSTIENNNNEKTAADNSYSNRQHTNTATHTWQA